MTDLMEYLYFLPEPLENEKKLRMIIKKLREMGYRTVYNRPRKIKVYPIYEVDKGFVLTGGGLQIIYYKDVLKVYSRLKKDPQTRKIYQRIKEKTILSSKAALSVTYIDKYITDNDHLLQLDIEVTFSNIFHNFNEYPRYERKIDL